MPDIVTDGQSASRSVVLSAFTSIQSTGQQVLDDLTAARTNLLVELELNLEQLNGKRQRASRLPHPTMAGRFLVSDFVDIDQAQTTATVRVNTESVTLRERATPSDAAIRTTTFSCSDGTIAQSNGIYRVSVSDGSVPLGVFKLQLTTAYNLSLVTFDILSMPSSPRIAVRTSSNDVTYTAAPQVSQNGYQVTAWFPSASVKFIWLEMTPSLPDTLNGNTYSFGITDFSASAIEFNLESELVTRAVALTPRSALLRFVADDDPNLIYFLSWDGNAFFQASNGDLITVPGSSTVNHTGVTINAYGQLGEDLPANVYPATLSIEDAGSGEAYRIAPGLDIPPYAARNGYMMVPEFPQPGPIVLAPYSEPDIPPAFNLSYQTGPASLNAFLRVQLTTDDPTLTPVFHGARLENT